MSISVVTTIDRDGVAFLPVNTTASVEAPAGAVVISANLREVKGTQIPAERKHRNVIIPELVCPESVEKKFIPLLLSQFYSLAKTYLETMMDESDRMVRELPLSAFTVDKLVEFSSRVAISGRLTGEAVAIWFDASATGKAIAEKIAGKGLEANAAAAMLKKYRDLFVKTASPNHGINPNTCTVLLAMLAESDTVEGSIGETLANRWQATITKSQQSEVDAL